MNKRSIQITAAVVAIIVIGVAGYAIEQHSTSSASSSPLIVYSADAYVQESSALLNAFHNQSGASIAPVKGGGALYMANQSGQGAPSDVFISVSLGSYGQSYLHSRYSGWAVAFASDQMVLAYSSATKSNASANQIISQFSSAATTNSTSAYNSAFMNLTSGNVKVGISNPNSDPAGFRGWLSLEIAGSVYHNNSSYYINRLSQNGGNISASNAAELVSPLESGNIQFLFIYKSAAIIKGLNYVSLPPTVNLGSVHYASFYTKFKYNLTSGSVSGAPIYLYVTALANATDQSTALSFAEYVLNHSSELSKYGLQPPSPEML